jgi:hypothetical protein
MGTTLIRGVKIYGGFLQRAGPYLLLLLPGGTLLAVLLLLYQGRLAFGAVDMLRHRRDARTRRAYGDDVGNSIDVALWLKPSLTYVQRRCLNVTVSLKSETVPTRRMLAQVPL